MQAPAIQPHCAPAPYPRVECPSCRASVSIPAGSTAEATLERHYELSHDPVPITRKARFTMSIICAATDRPIPDDVTPVPYHLPHCPIVVETRATGEVSDEAMTNCVCDRDAVCHPDASPLGRALVAYLNDEAA